MFRFLADNDRGRGASVKKTFANFIAPETLRDIVRNTAPFLFDRTTIEVTPAFGGPRKTYTMVQLPYWGIVLHSKLESVANPTSEQWVDYFKLCVAAHFATVGTFVPSDVDTKIRNHLWFDRKLPPEALTAMKDFALSTAMWDIRAVNQRWVADTSDNVVSGHDGERLSILIAGMLALEKTGDAEGAAQLENAATNEVRREAQFFLELVETKGRERDMLVAAAAITHNAGDIDQGFQAPYVNERAQLALGRLAHDRPERFDGAFAIAASLYKPLLSAEGHRNYPLRALKELRVDPDLLLPPSPFLDAWGERLSTRQGWNSRDKALVLEALMAACAKVKNQVGYYRAIAGMNAAYSGGVENLARELSVGARKALKEPHLQKALRVSRADFENDLAAKARKILQR